MPLHHTPVGEALVLHHAVVRVIFAVARRNMSADHYAHRRRQPDQSQGLHYSHFRHRHARKYLMALTRAGRRPQIRERILRVEMWRGGGRCVSTVSAPFVWRCRNRRTMTPSPHPAHRTGQAQLRHPALGQGIRLSPTGDFVCVGRAERAPIGHGDSRPDKSANPCCVLYASCVTTGAAAASCTRRSHGRLC